MAKADLYPKFCTGCGKPLIRSVLRTVEKYDGQTGEKIIVEAFELVCPDYPRDSVAPNIGVSPITRVKHDGFIYDIKK